VIAANRGRVVNAESGQTLVSRLELATTFWQRFLGWQFRSLPQAGSGLLIAPCNSIHTFWMRFAIDAIFLDAKGHVLAIKARVVPWRIVLPVSKAKCVLEIPAGSAEVKVGQRLAIADIRVTPLLADFIASESAD
jgi:uncharacterized protein